MNNKIRCCVTVAESLDEVKKFKALQIQRYQEFVRGHFQKKRPEYVERHAKLKRKVAEFTNMTVDRQVQNLFRYALDIGFMMCSTRAK